MKLLAALSLLVCVALFLAEDTDVESDVVEVAELMRHLDDLSTDMLTSEMVLQNMGKSRSLSWWRRRRRRRKTKRVRCSCRGNVCDCCLKVSFVKACVKIEYENGRVDLSLTALGKTLVSKSLAVHNTKPICAKVARIRICAEVYDAKIEGGKLHVCMRLTSPFRLKIACLNLAPKTQPITNAKSSDVMAPETDDVEEELSFEIIE